MTLHIVERPAVTVTGLHIRTRPMSPDIPSLWPRFMSRHDEIKAASEPYVTYGVMQDEPGSMSQFDYWAAIAVSSTQDTPSGMTSVTLPAGSYARFAYPFSKLGEGFGEIFHNLLPKSDYEQVPGPYFERYGKEFEPGDPNSLVEIYLPVKRKAARS